jgi:hypothetical protein
MTTTIWDRLNRDAHRVITSTTIHHHCKATQLVRDLHPLLPATPTDIITDAAAVNLVLPDLAELARRHNRHAPLLAAALMSRQLCAITRYCSRTDAAVTDDDAHTTLTHFWSTLVTVTTPTTRNLYAYTLKHVLDDRRASRAEPTPAAWNIAEPHCDADYTTIDTASLLDAARHAGIITALEHRTLRTIYLTDNDTIDLRAAAHILGASTTATARRAQRAIAKLRCAARTHRVTVAA